MIKTINLEASVAWAKSKLRDLLDDPADLIEWRDLLERLDEAVAVSHLSASEGREAISAAMRFIYACIGYNETSTSLMRKLGCIVETLRNDLCAWHDEAYRNELEARKTWCDPNIREHCEGRWESRGGAHWVELRHGPYDYHYVGGKGCGSVCNPNFPIESAVLVMESKLARGCFLPDDVKLPMKRIN